jgi:membrane-associated phospholipid phosphatase
MNALDSAFSALSCLPCDETAFAVRALGFLADAELLKGGFVMAILCALWMSGRGRAETMEIRGRIVATVAGAFGALCVARLLALVLPFRARPFDLAAGDAAPAFRALESWSAFPSDHAALFFALATGIFVISRRLGLIALLHALVIVTVPRIYLGLHHPSDMLAGAALGVACALSMTRPRVWRRCGPVVAWSEGRRAPWFSALAFVVVFELATLFDSVRAGARLVWPVVSTSAMAVAALMAGGGVLALVGALLVRGLTDRAPARRASSRMP